MDGVFMRRDLRLIIICSAVFLAFGIFPFSSGGPFFGELESGITTAVGSALDIRAGADYFRETREKVENAIYEFLDSHTELRQTVEEVFAHGFSGAQTVFGCMEENEETEGGGSVFPWISASLRQIASAREYIAREMTELVEWLNGTLENKEAPQE